MPTSYPICLWKPAALFDSHSIFPQPVHACRKAVNLILASGFQRLQPRLKPLKINRGAPSPLVGTDKSVPFPQTSAVYTNSETFRRSRARAVEKHLPCFPFLFVSCSFPENFLNGLEF